MHNRTLAPVLVSVRKIYTVYESRKWLPWGAIFLLVGILFADMPKSFSKTCFKTMAGRLIVYLVF